MTGLTIGMRKHIIIISLTKKQEKELTEEDMREIERYTANHIGFFLTWMIKHRFEGKIHRDDNEGAEAVRREELLGVDFFLDYCD